MVIVDIILATICFSVPPTGEYVCEPALVGLDTPRGTYVLQQRLTNDPLYGGDVLQFREDAKELYAIHRVWLGNPAEHRAKRLRSTNASDRKITKGCINVTPEVYARLLDCCSGETLLIK